MFKNLSYINIRRLNYARLTRQLASRPQAARRVEEIIVKLIERLRYSASSL